MQNYNTHTCNLASGQGVNNVSPRMSMEGKVIYGKFLIDSIHKVQNCQRNNFVTISHQCPDCNAVSTGSTHKSTLCHIKSSAQYRHYI